jgi:hypothetical protein
LPGLDELFAALGTDPSGKDQASLQGEACLLSRIREAPVGGEKQLPVGAILTPFQSRSQLQGIYGVQWISFQQLICARLDPIRRVDYELPRCQALHLCFCVQKLRVVQASKP